MDFVFISVSIVTMTILVFHTKYSKSPVKFGLLHIVTMSKNPGLWEIHWGWDARLRERSQEVVEESD